MDSNLIPYPDDSDNYWSSSWNKWGNNDAKKRKKRKNKKKKSKEMPEEWFASSNVSFWNILTSRLVYIRLYKGF